MKKILCLCFSATYQRSVLFDSFTPGEVNRSRAYSLYASGKAVNSARVLAQLEKNCAITVCPLGKENDQEFIELAQKDGLNLEYVSVPGKIRECWTLMDSSKGTTTELVVGEAPAACETTEPYDIKMLRLITEKLNECDAMILAGSRQGIWPEGFYADICGIALDKGKLVLADFVGRDLLDAVKRAVPSIIKINEREFEQTFAQAATKDNLCSKSRKLNNIIVVTRGEQSTLAAERGSFYECPSLKVNAINPIACGDTFNAGFIYEYLAGGNIEKALEKGNWCAAQNAMNEAPGSIIKPEV